MLLGAQFSDFQLGYGFAAILGLVLCSEILVMQSGSMQIETCSQKSTICFGYT